MISFEDNTRDENDDSAFGPLPILILLLGGIFVLLGIVGIIGALA